MLARHIPPVKGGKDVQVSEGPTHLPGIARRRNGLWDIVHCLLPPWRNEEIASVSNPGAIGIAWTGQRGSLIRHGDDKVSRRDVPAGSIGLVGDEPIAWLDVGQPSNIVEITASQALRQEIADELGVPQHANLADLHSWNDPVIETIALHLRAALRRWRPLGDLELESMVRTAYARALRVKFGGRARTTGALDQMRLSRVIDFAAANLHRTVTISLLADAAALSPYHFARSFQRSTGLAPHRFVTAMRLQRAAERLQHSRMTVEDISAEVGFSNLSHFRRLFRSHFGASPSAFRELPASPKQQDSTSRALSHHATFWPRSRLWRDP
jgi:AraC family transcriptional regulator